MLFPTLAPACSPAFLFLEEKCMSRGISIFTLIAACLPAWAAVEETPLRRSINSILEIQLHDRVVGTRIACDSFLPFAIGIKAADEEQANLFTRVGIICA